jgi:uncharacterized protein DUF6011
MNPSKLFELFDKARQHLKYPAIVIDNVTEKIKIGLGSDPNIIWVSNNIPKGYPNSKLYGKFTRYNLVSYRNDTFDLIPILEELCNDPIKFGALHGQQFKHCIFCNTELTSKASLFAGYGPICAENWGLPWGEVKDETLENL